MEVGVDICEIARIKKIENKPAFLRKILTEEEKEAWGDRLGRPESLAGIYAAKEAVMKVLGKGWGPVGFHDIEIFRRAEGGPEVSLSLTAQGILEAMGLGEVRLSISHDGGLAVASAVAGPGQPPLRFSEELNHSLLGRDRSGYKSQYGKLAILGGSAGMAGSVCMAAQAALRSGTGLVYVLVPETISQIVQVKLTEAIVIPLSDGGRGRLTPAAVQEILDRSEEWDCLAMGPGMGRARESMAAFQTLLPLLDLPLVLDADGLFALAEAPEILKEAKREVVITPHEMEMARLLGRKVGEIREERLEAAKEFSNTYGAVTVLKGPDTVITDGKVHYINSTGNPGMATAGSGDVLTGMLGGLIAHGYRPMLASRLAAYLHGLAGDLAAYDLSQEGMTAGDIISAIPRVFVKIGRSNKRGGNDHAED